MKKSTLSPSHTSVSGEKPLRIAFLVSEDRQTGTWFRYHNLAIALQKLGHQVTVYSQSSENRFRHSTEFRDGIPYLLSASIPGNRWIIPPVNPGNVLRRLFLPVAPADVYHLFQPFPSAAIQWSSLRHFRKGLFVYDWDDFWINEEFGLKNPVGFNNRWTAFCLSRLEKRLPARSDLVTAVSHPLADLAREYGAARSTVLHNGIWPTVPINKLAARKKLGLHPDAFYVGLMGWSGETEWALEAIRRFKTKFPTLRLAITGLDRSKDLGKYQDIRNRIDPLGFLPKEDFASFNPALDLGLVPMRSSEFNRFRLPFKLTDHLAGGVPVLCTEIGEAKLLSKNLKGIFPSEPNLESWLSVFENTVTKMLSGETGNRPDPTQLLDRFSWLRIARETTAAYRGAMRQTETAKAELKPITFTQIG